ncbi:MAG: sugar phosphate isomerase/epimerase [Chloroflexi bacterium]|nr:sugar phosphate isomerase/epimerase [Chloroflexota bacterium]
MVATPELKRMPMAWVGEYKSTFPKLAEMGYQGVELQVRDPQAFDTAGLGSCARELGLGIAAVSTGAVGSEDGLYLMSADPDIRGRAIERYKSVLQLAGQYGCDASIGRFRGMLAWGPDRQTAFGWFRAALDQLVPIAQQLGIRIVLEPQMRFIGDSLNTIAETVEFIRGYGSDALAFEGDTFHQSMEEKSLVASIVAGNRSGKMTYYQVSDSNRLAPGWGHHNWVDIVEVLRATGYDGWISIECNQQPDSESAARRAYATLGPLL